MVECAFWLLGIGSTGNRFDFRDRIANERWLGGPVACGGRFVEPGAILTICPLVSRGPQQIVVGGEVTFHTLWCGGFKVLLSKCPDMRAELLLSICRLTVGLHQ